MACPSRILPRLLLGCALLACLRPSPGVGLSAPTVLWQTQVEGRVSTTPVHDDERLYVGDRDGRVYALSKATGAGVWWTRAGAPGAEAGYLVRQDDRLYAQAGDQVAAIDPEEGAVLWSRPFRGRPSRSRWGVGFDSAPVPLQGLPKGLLLSDSLGTRVLASTGVTRWSRPEVNAATAVADGILYVNDGNHVAAVELNTGATLWSTPLGDRRGWSLQVHGDRVVATGLSQDVVFALDRRDGALLWRQEVEAWDWLRVLDVDGDHVYVLESRNGTSNSSDIGRLVILSAATGQVLVHDREGPNIDPSSFALEETIYLGRTYGFESLKGRVSAVGADGVERWSWLLPRAAQVRVAIGDVADGDSALYAADGGGWVYGQGTSYLRALGLADGAEAWRLALTGNHVLGPVVDGGSVYAATDGGFVYAVCGGCPVALTAVALSAPGLTPQADGIYRWRLDAGDRAVLRVHAAESASLPGDVDVATYATLGGFAPPQAPGQLRYLAPAAAPADTLHITVQQAATGFSADLTVVVELEPVRDERLRWRAATQGEVVDVLSDGRRLYAADRERTDGAGHPGSSGITAFDPATGAQHWRLRLPEGVLRIRVHGDVLYASLFAGVEGGLWAVRADDGRVLWQVPLARDPSAPEAGDGLVYIASDDTVLALDAATGRRRWAVDTGAEIGLRTQRLRLADGLLVADRSRDPLLVLDAAAGTVLWGVAGEASLPYWEPAVAAGRIFGLERGRLFAWAAATGRFLWSTAPVAEPRYAFVVGDTLYHGGEGELKAVSAADGHGLWHTTDPVLEFLPPAVHGGLLYTKTPGGFPAAFARADGRRVWAHPDEPGFCYFQLDRGVLYMVMQPHYTQPHQLRALDAATGQELWRHVGAESRDLDWTFALDPAGTRVYFGADEGYVSAVATDVTPGTAVAGDADGSASLPAAVSLGPSYPNPCNPAATIPFELPAAATVRLTLYDVLGQRVRVLVDEARAAGRHEVGWDGRDGRGRRVGAGVYLYELRAGDLWRVRRLVVLP